MKTTYKFIIALFAATLALASCTKDVIAEKEDVNPQDGLRTIAVSFGASTKTYLDSDLIPRFNGGEEILISNGDNYERLTVDASSGKPTITTTLSGKLVAVYPSKAAKLEGTSITGIQVPSNQTGRFADANIAIAKIDENQNYAMFQNQTAVLKFYVDRSIGVTALQIMSGPDGEVPISDGYINEMGETDAERSKERGFDTFSVTVMPEQKTETWTLADQTDDPEHRVCYVAVRAEGNPFTMRVKSRTNTQLYEEDVNLEQTGTLEAKQKGIVTRFFENVALKPGDLANVFIPYYIPVKVSDEPETYQYWGYCNIGAFLPEEPGYYFSWGNTDGHWLNGITDGYEFTADVYSNTPGGEITESRLTPESDAAYVAWGGKWRMPTKTESMILKGKGSWTYEKNGFCCGDMFLPSAGHISKSSSGDSMLNWNKGNASEFWTSSGNESSTISAHRFIYSTVMEYESLTYRYEGRPVRPIYGDPAPIVEIQPIETLTEGRTL